MNDQKRFTLRMDQQLFKLIEESAKLNKRSIAKEIEHRLEQHLKEQKDEN